MKLITILAFTLLLFSCQKEFNAPVVEVEVKPIIRELASIVITNGTHGDYDSIIYRYLAGKTLEIHYNYSGDSAIRSYYYDSKGRLSKLEDEKVIYYTNNDVAKTIRFKYNNDGDLIETSTDFNAVSNIKAYYNTTRFSNTKNVIIYDTLYKGASYDLDWVNRVIHISLDNDDAILYDSANYLSYNSGLVKTVVSAYRYDGNKNVTGINKLTYQNEELSEWGDVIITRDKPAVVFEALRKSLYRNLSAWYQTSSAMQDDSYQLFPIPGGMYKSISYKGSSLSGLATHQDIIRNYTFDNIYNSNDELESSQVTYTMSGQGNAQYVHQLYYYYK